ncbi:MAG: Mini-ribonuclease 3 [Acutalibacteraceae bacterium]
MERLYPKEIDVRTLSPLTLAFVGDGVYEMLVRERLVCLANRPPRELHREAVSMVRAEAQSEAMNTLLPLLTEQETAVFKRGRNAHTARAGDDYHRATGLEALFGYLYLNGEIERVRCLFGIIMGDTNGD